VRNPEARIVNPGYRFGVLPSEAIDVLDSHQFDVRALARYLAGRLPGVHPPLLVRQFRGGQSNPTYYIETPACRLVLRRKPPGQLLPSAHAIEREYQVMTALRDSGVPVPRTHFLCEDPGVIGTAFFVMDYVDSHPMTDPSLPDRAPEDRRAIYRSMIETLARLHAVEWRAAGLSDYGKPANYVARQIQRWTGQYRASETERIEAMERLIDWLPLHIPAETGAAIVHGDYRPGNLLLHPTEPRVAAVIDWELSTIGHPLVDLAHHALLFRTGPDDFGAFGDRPRPAGIPTEAEHVEAYCRLTGRHSLADWGFYIAFAMFRFAAICQGIMGRVVAGTANDPDARRAGARARPLAERAWGIVVRELSRE
jgi:aminoglycoside phosphotransferase (APT) family kinase protein